MRRARLRCARLRSCGRAPTGRHGFRTLAHRFLLNIWRNEYEVLSVVGGVAGGCCRERLRKADYCEQSPARGEHAARLDDDDHRSAEGQPDDVDDDVDNHAVDHHDDDRYGSAAEHDDDFAVHVDDDHDDQVIVVEWYEKARKFAGFFSWPDVGVRSPADRSPGQSACTVSAPRRTIVPRCPHCPHRQSPHPDRHLLGLGEEIVGIAVEDHTADRRQRDQLLGNELGCVENVEREALGLLLCEDLQRELPFRIFARLDRRPQVATVIVRIARS